MTKPPDDVIVLAIRSISGEITRSMRMIAFQFDGNSAMFRYYMDSEPTDDEREMAEIVALNFDAGLPTTLSSVGVEFVVTNDPLGRLDVLDFGLYRRWEAT